MSRGPEFLGTPQVPTQPPTQPMGMIPGVGQSAPEQQMLPGQQPSGFSTEAMRPYLRGLLGGGGLR